MNCFGISENLTTLEEDMQELGLATSKTLTESKGKGKGKGKVSKSMRGAFLQQMQAAKEEQEPEQDSEVNGLVEEVNHLVESVANLDREEIVRAYANAAIVADTLATRFTAMAESLSEALEGEEDEDILGVLESLVGLAEEFTGMAEDAAESAEALKSLVESGEYDEHVDEEILESHFGDILAGILDGLEVYETMTEGKDEDEDEEDEDEEDDDEDEDEDKKDDEEEEESRGKKGGKKS